MDGSKFLQSTLITSAFLAGMLFLSHAMPVTADESAHVAEEQEAPPVEVRQLEPVLSEAVSVSADEEVPAAAESEGAAQDVEPLMLLESWVAPGTLRRLSWYATEHSDGLAEPTPVLVAHGSKPGPVLCLTAAVHGDELNGVEIVRNLLYEVDPERLNGTIIGVPIVNLHGFRVGSRYFSDRRDLNRYFPGDPSGSSTSRIAYSLFHSLILECDYLVDLHTGSFHRTNLPQLRADLNNESVLELTKGFGATVVLDGSGPDGSLRAAATAAGIPAVTLEAGEPMRVQPDEVNHGLKALRSLLNHLDMMSRFTLWGEPQPVYYKSQWVRAEDNGILTSTVELGDKVDEGELLGNVVDPITNSRSEIRSPVNGRIIGMALNQSMRPGYAAYHIGIPKTEEQLIEEASVELNSSDSAESTEGEQDGADTGEIPDITTNQ